MDLRLQVRGSVGRSVALKKRWQLLMDSMSYIRTTSPISQVRPGHVWIGSTAINMWSSSWIGSCGLQLWTGEKICPITVRSAFRAKSQTRQLLADVVFLRQRSNMLIFLVGSSWHGKTHLRTTPTVPLSSGCACSSGLCVRSATALLGNRAAT